MNKPDRIIMLPKVKESLETKLYNYIANKNFTEALAVAEQLINHDVDEMNINLAKLSCLTELNKLDEAIIFIEKLLSKEDENYFTYFEIYIGLLYETNQFEEMMRVIDEKEIPEELKEAFNELYRIAFQTNEKIKLASSKELLTELEVAINTNESLKQWNLINQLRKINIKPPEKIIELLKLASIHPVVKTTIFSWLRETQYSKEVKITKFEETKILIPSDTDSLTTHSAVIKTIFYLTNIEEENPTLYQMIEEMLIKYIYVNYPILYEEKEAQYVAEALEYLCKRSLYGELNKNLSDIITNYMDNIEYCYKVYFEVIES